MNPPDWLRREEEQPPTVLAHRGGTGPWRENTLEAYEGARAAGADGVELDVRLGADEALVIVHDAALPTLGAVHALQRDELPSWMPLLPEALGACRGLVVDVEIKNSPFDPGYDPTDRVAPLVAAAVVEALAAPAAPRAVFVTSFNPATVRAAARELAVLGAAAGPAPGAEVPALGLLVAPGMDAGALATVAADEGWSVILPPPESCDPGFVAEAQRRGLAVCTWTVNEPAALQAVAGAGVDAVITDEVASVLGVLHGAGAGPRLVPGTPVREQSGP